MIGWNDVYNVVVAMVPLYVPLFLGYASVKWWNMFTSEQCNAINGMTCFFILPLFIFEFTSHINPFKMNYIFVAGDVISKCFIIVLIWGCTYFYDDSLDWCITNFSMSSITNGIIMGSVVMRAMYGSLGEELVVQSVVLQTILWVMTLMFMLEVRRVRQDFNSVSAIEKSGKDLEENNGVQDIDDSVVKPSFWLLAKTVLGKLAKNPNCLACLAGLIWALLAGRWHFEMPSIIEGSITVMSKAATGTSMFGMGLFMALNKKIFACSAKATAVTMISRFIIAPFSLGLACFALGLRGDLLRIIIVQAALPPAVLCFIYAKEYGLHAEVTSTGVIFGTMLSLPIVIAYYAVVECIDF